MSLYLVVVLNLPLLLLVFSSRRDAIGSKLLFIAFYSGFVFFHLDSGPDHVIYQWLYENNPSDVSLEPIYVSLSSISRMVGFDYFEFLYLLKIINIFTLSVAVVRLEKYKLLFFLGFYIPIALITFELNLLRQSLGLHFGLLAVIYLTSHEKLKAYLSTLVAILSHLSLLLLALCYIKKVNSRLLFVMVVFFSVALFNAEYIFSKISDYSELGAINFRFDVSIVQMLILSIMPFLFFKLRQDGLPAFLYVLICIAAVVPVLFRLYPLGLLVLLPHIEHPRTKNHKLIMCIFVLISSVFAVGKTYLLLQADHQSIQDGIYIHGYQTS